VKRSSSMGASFSSIALRSSDLEVAALRRKSPTEEKFMVFHGYDASMAKNGAIVKLKHLRWQGRKALLLARHRLPP
jgi:hypothetical protein